jgi:hypothetical protein
MGEMMSGHGHADTGNNKQIALLIAVLALFLAIAETLAKGAQTEAISRNVEASNLWAFFQAKTIRQTAVRTAGEMVQLQSDAPNERTVKQIQVWRDTVARWESEPPTQEGRKELMARAKQAEDKRDLYMAKYHQYEIASAAFQIGIVLSSAMVITGVAMLGFIGAGLGLIGLIFTGIGLWAPHAIHLF